MPFLDNVVRHRKELCLNRPVQEVRQQTQHDHEHRPEPKKWARPASLDEDLVGCRRKKRREGTVDEQERVPEGDAAPDYEMLHPREVVDRERHLAVDGPHDARVHVDPQHFVVDDAAVPTEGLVRGRAGGEEEDNDRADDPVEYPAENPRPTEEDVPYSFFI